MGSTKTLTVAMLLGCFRQLSVAPAHMWSVAVKSFDSCETSPGESQHGHACVLPYGTIWEWHGSVSAVYLLGVLYVPMKRSQDICFWFSALQDGAAGGDVPCSLLPVKLRMLQRLMTV